MQIRRLEAALAVSALLCLTSVTIVTAASEEERKAGVANGDSPQEQQPLGRGSDKRGGEAGPSEARPAQTVEAELGRLRADGLHENENARLRASRKKEGPAAGDPRLETRTNEKSLQEAPAPENTDQKTDEVEGSSPLDAEGSGPSADDPSESAAPVVENAINSAPRTHATFRDDPDDYENRGHLHVSTDAQAAVPLFADLQQLNIPLIAAAQFSGITNRVNLLSRSDPTKPRKADGAAPSLHNLFDLPGSTVPFFPFGESTGRPGDAPRTTTPPAQWLPVIGGDLRLPEWPGFGSGAGWLKNVTIGLPGLGHLRSLPFGTPAAELPPLPSLSDLLQDPLNNQELQNLFEEALAQVRASPLNAERLKDIVDEIARRVTPQESFLVKQIARAQKERDAKLATGLAEAVLEAAAKVGQQFKILKEVDVAGAVTPDGDVSANGSRIKLLGDLKEVLEIEEAFTQFRSILEQLLAPLVNLLPAILPSYWGVPNWA